MHRALILQAENPDTLQKDASNKLTGAFRGVLVLRLRRPGQRGLKPYTLSKTIHNMSPD